MNRQGMGAGSPGPLADLRVVECAEFIAGPYCGKLLADLGAEVIKIEPPEHGDMARRAGPFPGDDPDAEKSGLFLYLNTNKFGLTLDLHTTDGLGLFHRLLEQADILIDDHPPQVAKEWGIDYDTLHKRHPKLIVVSTTPFGQTGPYKDYAATDLTTFHISGMAFDTPQQGVESLDLPPIRPGGYQSLYLSGLATAAGAMMGVFARNMDGAGQLVDVSQQEVLIDIMVRINLHQYTYEGQTPSRLRPTERLVNYVPCKNGYVNILIHEPHWWQSLVGVMGNPEWAQDPLFKNTDFRAQVWDAVQPLIEEWAKNYTKEELFPMLQKAHIPCLPGNTFADVVHYEHFNARGFFVDVDHPGRGIYRFPGPPYRFSKTPWAIRAAAPRLGEHNERVYHELLGVEKEDMVRLRAWGVI